MNKTIFVLLGLSFWGAGCSMDCIGTGCGNPTALSSKTETDFPETGDAYAQPTFEYYQNCGDFTSQSSETSIEEGRQCIRNALKSCTPSKYHIDQTKEYRLSSFVHVEEASTPGSGCFVQIQTICNDPNYFIGTRETSCTQLSPETMIEFSCGILD